MSWITLECSHRVKIRKAHICEGCGRRWPAGILMETWTGMWSGEPPGRVYACLVCIRFCNEAVDTSDEIFDRSLPDRGWSRYVQTEAKLALYVINACVTPMAARPERIGS